MMITIVAMLETGYPKTTPEFLGWKQLAGAYQVKLAVVGHHYVTMEEALAEQIGHRIFFIPPGRTESINFKDFIPPEGDIVYVFGWTNDNLVKYIQEDDIVVSIHTPFRSELMAISVAGIVLNEYR